MSPDFTSMRDRIAAALYVRAGEETTFQPLQIPWPETYPSAREYWLGLADAVIEALDLGIPCANDGCRMRQIARRSADKFGLTGDGE